MPGAGATRLGQVARKLICPDKWTDGYPGPDAYVTELDVLLKFADERGCLYRFVPTLESRDKQRDEAINELRLAYLLDSLGFTIVGWDPPGANGKKGQFTLESPEKVQIFTEIKSPGWESELSPKARAAGRTKEPKYKGLAGGAVGNWRPVHRCISSEKTYPKFTDNQSNLLIISDDLFLKLFYSLFQVEGALYGPKQHYEQDGYFTTNQFENIGGLGIFNCESNYSVRGISYEFIVYENHSALPATKLPPSLLKFTERLSCAVRGTQTRTGGMDSSYW
jgi:hypothetical protein